MNLFEENNWEEKLIPVIEKYKGRKHPLDYQNHYQLIVMVILSARDSDANINKIAPSLFNKFPDFESISKSSLEEFTSYLTKVTNYHSKAKWIYDISNVLKKVIYQKT